MRIGTINLTPRPPTYQTAILLRSAWTSSAPPLDHEIELAALGLSSDLPGLPPLGHLDYYAFGRIVEGLLRTSGATDREILCAARAAYNALPTDERIAAEMARWTECFSPTPGSSSASGSGSDTSEASPSAG